MDYIFIYLFIEVKFDASQESKNMFEKQWFGHKTTKEILLIRY